MSRGSDNINLVIQAALKLDTHSDRWHNVIAFIQSCYGGRVRDYDLALAQESLTRLNEQETHALIVWVLQIEEMRHQMRKTA